MKKMSKTIILIAFVLIIASLLMIFLHKNSNNLIDKEIVWETINDDSIDEQEEYIIDDLKETIKTYNNIDVSFVYPSELFVSKIADNRFYYSANFTIDFDSTRSTYEEYTNNLKERCSDLFEKCSLKRTKIDSKTYKFSQETIINDIYQENIIILSNENLINYHLIGSKLSDDNINTLLKRFNYKSISESKYNNCKNNTCSLDLKDLIGYKLTINYDSSVYKKYEYNNIYSSEIAFEKKDKGSDAVNESIKYQLIYNSQLDAINEVQDIDNYEYVGEETINNKTFKHYTHFDGATREEAYYYDVYLDIIKPELLIKISINSHEDNAKEIIEDFTNYVVE